MYLDIPEETINEFNELMIQSKINDYKYYDSGEDYTESN